MCYWLLALGFFFCMGQPVHAAEPVVVVLDPGHGGANLGAEYEDYTEKEMTMAVAKAMKEELEKYEDIEVYLTHEGDKDMSLEERAAFARNMNADFLFCLHFNMSENHNLFGAEVWVSAFGDKYQKGYTFASVEMELLEKEGLYSRGIKTRLNDKGEDYYGILRHATAMDVPAALIEHCHLDQANDQDFYNSEEKLKRFGILDATAVAKYFGLRSEILGVDYSNYKNVEVAEPVMPVKPDTTEPDVCVLEVGKVDAQTGEVTLNVSAADYDSYILYYSYSYDGGETFSDLQRWEPRGTDHISFSMKVPSGILGEAVVNVYNGYDRITESNHVSLPSMYYEEAVEAGNMSAESNAGRQKAGTGNGTEQNAEDAGQTGTEGEAQTGNAGISDADASGYAPASETGRDGKGTAASGTDGPMPGITAEGRSWQAGEGQAEGAEGNAPRMTVTYFLQVCLVCVAILLVLVLSARLILAGKMRVSSKKKRRRRK